MLVVNLQALVVVVVELGASGSGLAAGGSTVSDTSALSPLARAVASWGWVGGGGGGGGADGGGSGGGGSGGGGANGRSGGGGGGSTGGSGVGRVELTEADVGEGDLSVWRVGLNIGWVAGVAGAGTTGDTWGGWVLVKWVGGVEPQHAGSIVIPDGHDKDGRSNGSTHGGISTESLELVLVTEGGLLSITESIGDGVTWGTGVLGGGVLNNNAVLDVLAADLNEGTRGGSVVSDELSDDGHLGVGVELLVGAWSVESGVTHSVGVEVTSVLVANGLVTVSTVTAVKTLAS